ncbi:aspartate ammonia-lyase [Rhodococcus sp. ACT016]|uniref:aspartate ammonia-lyase n=1 Tax=Rhodococcus sp. ACT016 TaxID=3134808 RepID=UPI003D2C2DF9
MRATPAEDAVRIETDSLGSLAVPASAYYGIHTMRAAANFPITGRTLSVYPHLLSALAQVKSAAAAANRDLGQLDEAKADAIITACAEITAGALHDQFIVDVLQGGAGTSTNMNSNEVVANRALEHLGRVRGDYQHLHPIDDVNHSQSTNDVYPTALKLALRHQLTELSDSFDRLIAAFDGKAAEFRTIGKVGRTQLQDAVPMTLGQEFGAYVATLREEIPRFADLQRLLAEINLGGTAIGTGLNTHPQYVHLAAEHLAAVSGRNVTPADDLIEATQDTGVFVQVSATIKRAAVKLSKISNDLRLLSSGPQHGFAEINLPPMQAGSSIMPGKVNPVIPEVVNQVAFEIIGNDMTITIAAEAGQLQLNAFEPVIALSLFDGIRHLTAAAEVLADRCVTGITANTSFLAEQLRSSASFVTALTPWIGYADAAKVASEAVATRQPIEQLVLARGLMTHDELAQARLRALPDLAR